MGWCSLVLVSVVLMHHGTFKTTPLDDLTINLNLNDAPNGPILGSPGIKSEEWKTGKTSIKDPPSQERGPQTDKKRKRILGGTEYRVPRPSSPPSWDIPDWEHWTASLRVTYYGGIPPRDIGYNLCGGVLITRQHILTALHCIIIHQSQIIVNYNDVEIFFDPFNLEEFKGFRFTPIRFYYTRMPNRRVEIVGNDKDIIKDDIVLIKLNKLATFPLRPILRSKQDAINTVRNKDKTNNFWIGGWGINQLPDQTAEFLQYTHKIWSVRCPYHLPTIQTTHACFWSTSKDTTCEGDSGSPGVIRINKPQTNSSIKPAWRLQTIHIRSPNCSNIQPGYFSVDIDVHKYKTEIDLWLTK